jgi:[ribosomal protein S5]-alanine N-acetyltransferase
VSGSRAYFLATERLGFGHWNGDDLVLATTLWGDPRVSVWIGGPFTAEQVKARLDREIELLLNCKVQYWPVFLLKDGQLAGCAGLRPYGTGEHVLELGFHFRPEYWGQGLAHEAAQGVIAFAFEALEVEGLFAGHHPENAASERLLRKLGFRYTHQEIYPPTGLLNPSYLLKNPNAP